MPVIEMDFKIDSAFGPTLGKLIDKAMTVALVQAVNQLHLIADQQIEELEAHDTYALKESIYQAYFYASNYEDAVAKASDAYMNNPTAWEEIREKLGGVLKTVPEIKPENVWTAYLASCAGHALPVEVGYISFYGNHIPPRPVFAQTARIGHGQVMAIFRGAVRSVCEAMSSSGTLSIPSMIQGALNDFDYKESVMAMKAIAG